MENKKLTDAFFIAELIRRSVQGEPLTDGESAMISEWRQQDERNAVLFDKMHEIPELAESLVEIDQTDTEAQLADFKRMVSRRKQAKRLYRFTAIAAVILGLLALTLYIFQASYKPESELTSQFGGDLLPGGNRATLTLADGSTIALSEDKTGIIIGEGLTYDDGTEIETAEVAYATLATPMGGQYRITLADGTNVWLNAGSSLTYPTRFIGDERVVQLKGEGYFEVKPSDGRPFVVRSQQQELEVLGTAFNVSAYEDEGRTVTTLVTGSVRIGYDGSKQILTPGEQATVQDGAINVKEVASSKYIGWKDGYFVFDGADLSEVVRHLSRWYDVEVDYATMPDRKLNAKVSRNKNISTVLSAISKTTGLNFYIEERRLYLKE